MRVYQHLSGADPCDDCFFACKDGSCILNGWKCDNGKDCEDGEDESPEFCSKHSFFTDLA